MDNLTEGEDFHPDSYRDEQGYIVFTEKYHLQKGFCCGNGCRHCPYEYVNVPEPKRSELLSLIPDGKKINSIPG